MEAFFKPAGNFTPAPADQLNIEIGGLNAGVGYDQVQSGGLIQLAGALDLEFLNGYLPAIGDAFTIISNTATTGSNAISGQFTGLGEGASFTENGITFVISYHGGDGNDVVLRAIGLP